MQREEEGTPQERTPPPAPPPDGHPAHESFPTVAPAPRQSTSRRWLVVLASVAVVLALLLGGSVAWLLTGASDGDPGSRDDASSATGEPSATRLASDAAAKRYDAVVALLEARSRAILGKDRAAFLAQIDPAADEFRERQATIFDRLVKVPLSAWEYDYAGEVPGLQDEQARDLPEDTFVARAVLRYTFAGSDSPVETYELLAVAPRGDRWLLVGDRGDVQDEQAAALGREIWELGPITVVRGRTSLVIGEARPSVLRAYARQADQAVRDVGAVWTRQWSRRPVVIVPRTQADMAAIVGTPEKGLEQIAAVTTGWAGEGRAHGDRVVINPAAWRDLVRDGRRVVMTHEVTHLATRAATYGSVPIWLAEGFADYVAYEAVDVPVDLGAQSVLEQVRDGKGPRSLPSDTDFDPVSGDIAPAYESSWLATKMIADRYGEQKLVRLYLAMADSTTHPPTRDYQTVLGISEQKLLKEWQAYMRSAARG